MNLDLAVVLLEGFHEAQRAYYLYESDGKVLRGFLTEDVVWRVPGDNVIAGTYTGVDGVMEYFGWRRELARQSFRILPGEVLVGEGQHVAVVTEGTAVFAHEICTWDTMSLFKLEGTKVAECSLLPLNYAAFDEIWRSAH